MRINEVYTAEEITNQGLTKRNVTAIKAKIYSNDQKIYFFEPVNSQAFRLYSIINKRSFFL